MSRSQVSHFPMAVSWQRPKTQKRRCWIMGIYDGFLIGLWWFMVTFPIPIRWIRYPLKISTVVSVPSLPSASMDMPCRWVMLLTWHYILIIWYQIILLLSSFKVYHQRTFSFDGSGRPACFEVRNPTRAWQKVGPPTVVVRRGAVRFHQLVLFFSREFKQLMFISVSLLHSTPNFKLPGYFLDPFRVNFLR